MRKSLVIVVVSVLSLVLTVLIASQMWGEASLADAVRPDTIEATVAIEGDETLMDLKLFVAPANWPARFSTYYPEDFIVETSRTLEGFTAKFTANFGGTLNPDAFLEVFQFAPGTKQAEMDALVNRLVQEYKLTPSDGNRYEWSTAEYAITVASPAMAHLAVGLLDGQPIYLLMHYPVEYGDGFGPRAEVILDQWEWSN